MEESTPRSEALPSLSIIVVTFNCERNLQQCLTLIQEQDYPRNKYEILVVDGGSTDGTLKVAESFGARILIRADYRDNQEARRAVGLLEAAGQILAYIDSDNYLPDRNWLRAMVRPFVDDGQIVGTQTLRYAYRPLDSALNRYHALLGATDPVAFYLGKQDRLSWAAQKWKRARRIEDRGDYFAVDFDPMAWPTLGCNGFLIRKDLLLKSQCDPDLFFHIDVTYDLAKLGFTTYGIVKNAIIHTSSETFFSFMRKRWRYMRNYHLTQDAKRRYLVYDSRSLRDRIALARYVFFSLTVLRPTLDALQGYAKIRDRAWFIHPFVCLSFLMVYGGGYLVDQAQRMYAKIGVVVRRG